MVNQKGDLMMVLIPMERVKGNVCFGKMKKNGCQDKDEGTWGACYKQNLNMTEKITSEWKLDSKKKYCFK